MLYVKKRIITLFACGVISIVWWYMRPKFDPTQGSLINNDADYPILNPRVLPYEKNEEFFLIVIISSAPKGVSYERRKAIRETWGKMESSTSERRKFLTLFMTGMTGDSKADEKLLEESRSFGDLIICDYVDHYGKILNKLLASFKWAVSVVDKYKYQYILKTDDDVFVNIPRLFRWIDDVGSKMSHVYAGVLYSGDVVRDKTHRHYVSKEELPYDYFPEFCTGPAILLSKNLLPKIVELSKKIHRIIPDDAYIGLIMNELKVKPTRLPGLWQESFMRFILNITGFCFFKNAVGLSDSLSNYQIRGLHQEAMSNDGSSIIWCYIKCGNVFWLLVIIFMVVSIRYREKICNFVLKRQAHDHLHE